MNKTAITITAEACADGVRRHCLTEHSHKLMQGYYLLQARAVFALPAEARGQGRKSSATVALDLRSEESSIGFDQFITEELAGFVSRRTAFNYMTAASRAGIDLAMSEPEAEAAATAFMQGEMTLSALYKALPNGGSDVQPSMTPPPVEPEQMWMEFGYDFAQQFAPESKAVRMLPLLGVEKLQTLLDHLKVAEQTVKEVIEAKIGKKGGRGK